MQAGREAQPAHACSDISKHRPHDDWASPLQRSSVDAQWESQEIEIRQPHINRNWLLCRMSWVQLPAPTGLLTSTWNSRSRESDALFRPLQALHTMHSRTCRQNTHKHIIINKQLLKQNVSKERRQKRPRCPQPLLLQASLCPREAAGSGTGQRGCTPKPHSSSGTKKTETRRNDWVAAPHPTVHPKPTLNCQTWPVEQSCSVPCSLAKRLAFYSSVNS